MNQQSGRAGRRWRTLRDHLRSQHDPCWLCGQPIDYSLPREHPWAFTVDHAIPRSVDRSLAEDPANLRAAHRHCNLSRGAKTPRPGLGARSTSW